MAFFGAAVRERDLVSHYARHVRNAEETAYFHKHQHRYKKDCRFPIELLDGRTLYVRGGTNEIRVFDRIFIRDVYHIPDGLDKKLGIVIDIGAHIGLFSSLVSPLAERVICYEPMRVNLELLELNTSGLGNVEIVAKAVGSSNGNVRIYQSKKTHRCAEFPEAGVHEEKYDLVPSVTLDDLFKQHEIRRCELLKMDVEGSEYGILWSADEETLRKIGRIHFEYHNINSRDPCWNGPALLCRLSKSHFELNRFAVGSGRSHRDMPLRTRLFASRECCQSRLH